MSHFEEKDDFILVTEKELMLDKADPFEKGYEMDENVFSRNPGKATSLSDPSKQNVDVGMLDDDSNKDTKE
jgi:hypothetical protein